MFFLSAFKNDGGDEEDRTPDPLLAGQVLSQLSYTPNSLPLKAAFALLKAFLQTFKIKQHYFVSNSFPSPDPLTFETPV